MATLRAPDAPVLPLPPVQDARIPGAKTPWKAAPKAKTLPQAGVVAAEAVPKAAEGLSVIGAGREAAAPAGGGAATAAIGEAAGPDADGLRAYRIGLAREARIHRHYPPLALERGWTGTAEVQVDVSRQGLARQILLARSSGHEVLDREALSMMSRAAVSAALPDSLRGRDFAVRLPVVFDLADTQ